ncbi:response regulator transcription factor [Catenovulum maritimum]|uniref:XRE family transcriptional regulator n=1 Tax=Catenovulum maritimum TaxID=1513271 RepID=A0A0J8GZQ2_9ALTE|nr:response regulator transcription factor [Catenovulum maritimum]KMT66714.1 XRE family transcriptional regulator [Catenovulum maritimum]
MRILLVEDDFHLANGLKASLKHGGYTIDLAETGELALSAAKFNPYDCIILDLGLPDLDGLYVLKQLKRQKYSTAVLILTARDGVEHKVAGLDLGADDYLSKPFNMEELLARLRVIERRLGTHSSFMICHKEVTLDTRSHTIEVNQQPISLSRREYMIIKSLMENIGRILSKEQLENKLYEWGEEIASNTIEVHISNIRKKLPINFIKTVRGVGYVVSKN